LETPLDRVREVHLSRPYFGDHLAVDAHLPPEDDDFTLLRLVLERTAPTPDVLVALEYYQDLGRMLALQQQLADLLQEMNVRDEMGRPGGYVA
jgi:uncharacterized protein (UPF0276 family)